MAAYGTPGYVSPEAQSQQSVGAPADIFSLGKVIEFMVSGRKPTGDPTLIADPKIAELVHELTASNPAVRPDAGSISLLLNNESNLKAELWKSLFHRRAIKKLPRRIRPLTAFMTVLVTAILVFLLSFLILRQEKESRTISKDCRNL